MDPGLLVGIGDSNDSLFAMSADNFPYQTSVSFNAGSMSTCEVSPSTASLKSPFVSFGVPVPTHDSMQSLATGAPTVPTSCQRSTERSFSSTASTSTPVSGAGRDRTATSDMKLSSAPQTKYEQQKLALDKLTKSNIDIKDIVQRVLEAQQQQDGVLDDVERASISQVVEDFFKHRPTSMRRSLTQGSASNALQQCQFKDCKFSGRTCDLNKHKKRHEKPYGCTYPKCHKRFGAKSDWKRHENSQHFQLEVFRCDHPNSSGERCGQYCNRASLFHKHIAEKHGIISDAQVKSTQQRCKIGKNCQGQFWCGFCRSIEALQRKRNSAWDERFDHIARHFEKEKKSIDGWLCVEENRTKRELQEEVDRDAFPDDVDLEVDTGTSDDNELPVPDQVWPPTTAAAFQLPIQEEPKIDRTPVKRPRPTVLWTCVSGPVLLDYQG